MSSPVPPNRDESKIQPLDTQELYQQFLLQQSLARLESITHPHVTIQSFDPNTLYTSCEIVGRHCGVSFKYPVTQKKSAEVDISFERGIQDLCLHSQVYYRKIKLPENWWKQFDFAYVGFYGEEPRPIALIPHFTKQYQLIDPATNASILVDHSIAELIVPEVYQFYRPLPEHKLTFSNLWTFTFWHRAKEWLTFLFLACCCLLFSVLVPMITKLLFDHVIPHRHISLLVQIGAGTLLLIFTTLIFNYNRESLLLRLMGLIDHDLELAIWQRMMNLPVHFFRKYSLYDLFTLTSSVTYIRQLATGQAVMVFLNAIFSVFFLALLIHYGGVLAFVGLGIIGVQATVILFLIPFLMRYGKRFIDTQINSNNRTYEIIQSISKIRLACAEVRFFNRWEEAFTGSKRAEKTMQMLKMKMSVFNAFWSNMGLGILYFFAIYLLATYSPEATTQEKITIGSFLAFMAVFSFLSSSLQQILKTILQVSLVAPLWERIKEFTSVSTEDYASKGDPGVIAGEIRLEQVSFGYTESTTPLLKNLSLTIMPGQCAAVVGLSGCGKSTLVRLLLGFEVPQEGVVYYDSKDIKGLNLQLLRAQLGVGLQSGTLIDGSLRDNITSGRSYSEEQINAAVYLSGMDSFLQDLPMGLNTLLTNGGLSLSGGQRQMVLLARALIGNPKVLILDESTNSIDSKLQLEIHKRLSKLPITRVMVTQRIDILRGGVDVIYVMDQGQVIAQGTFSDLEKSSKLFAKLLEESEPHA